MEEILFHGQKDLNLMYVCRSLFNRFRFKDTDSYNKESVHTRGD